MGRINSNQIFTIHLVWYNVTIYKYNDKYRQEKNANTIVIGKYITAENRSRAVKIRGLPYNVTEEDIMIFFSRYNLVYIWIIYNIEKNRYYYWKRKRENDW